MNVWHSALATSRNSATHLVANISIFAAAAVECIAQFGDQLIVTAGDLFQDPELKTQLHAIIPNKWWPLAMIGIMVVIKIARNRTMAK